MNSSLTQLVEVFPSWSKEDLLMALNEAGGDVYVAISRISEGHVSQWSDSTKKPAISITGFESRSSSRPEKIDRSERGNRKDNNRQSNVSNKGPSSRSGAQAPREQRDRPNLSAKTAAVVHKNPVKVVDVPSDASLSWGEIEVPSVPVAISQKSSTSVIDRNITASKTSFAAAAASALAENPILVKKESPKISKNTAKVETEIGPSESIVSEVEPLKTPEIETSTISIEEPTPVVVSIELTEDDIVSMPSRTTPSLTMEQPAVILPIRTNLRTNLSVRFGYDSSSEDLNSASAIEEVQSIKTPITVSALESTFAMLSASPAPAPAPAPIPAKSPEPVVVSSIQTETSSWDNSRGPAYVNNNNASTASSSSGYGNFSRGSRPNGSWDYEIGNNAQTSAAPANAAPGSFGPAPGFNGPSSPAAVPQRFVSRAAAQYEHSSSVYNVAPPTSNMNTANSRFSPYEESPAIGNNVSQYYTTRAAPQPTQGYSTYRGGSSFNASRYPPSSRPYYQQQHHSSAHHHVQGQGQVPSQQQSSASTGTHYSPYNPHPNYLNSYHHGYPQYPEHPDQYNQQQSQQPQQPYYQPYQPPNQYLSNSNMHHHHHNQHHNA